jgi:TPR repeat protein
LFGRGVAKDYSESTRWQRLSAEQGNPSAQLSLSVAYYTGGGVPQNYVEAYKWANLAAAQGKEKAKEAQEFRDEVTQKMTPSQIEEGQRLSSIEALKIQSPKNQTLQESPTRMAIPSEVRREVWRRDNGVCVKCGSRLNLEYDHIVPVSKGGSNTARNIELLCQACNRAKSASIQ